MKRSSIIFLSSILLGFLIADFSKFLSPYTNIFLIILMVFSLKNVKFHKFSKKHLRHVQWFFIASLFSGLVLIYASSFLFQDSDILAGHIIYGLMPPAIGVVSISYLLKSDVEEALITETVSYSLYLFLTPVLVWFFLGSTVSVSQMFIQLLLLIVLPLVIAFLTRHVDTSKHNKLIVELCFAAIFFTVIGSNSNQFVTEPELFVFLFFFIMLFKLVFLSLFHFLGERFSMPLMVEKGFVLFSTLKNSGLASVMALNLLPERALMPVAAEVLTFPLFMVLLEWYYFLKKPHIRVADGF